MNDKNEKHYIIYQITNKINGKIYVGKHITSNLDDGYMGSGKVIQLAIQKYGINNFEKTILFECNSEYEMNQKEEEIVNENFIARDDTYNLIPGGYGGWEAYNKILLDAPDRRQQRKIKLSNAMKQLWKNTEYREKTIQYLNKNGHNTFLNKRHTEETKRKIGAKNHINNMGSNNPNYGHHWWKDPNDKTKFLSIKEGDPIPEGWVRGKWQIFSTDGMKKIKETSKKTINKVNEINFERNKKKFFPILSQYKEYLINHTWKEFIKAFNYRRPKKYLLKQFELYSV